MKPQTNSEKLRLLADWFDGYDFSSKGFLNHNEVQKDLRSMADEFENRKLDIAVLNRRIDEQNILIQKQYNMIKLFIDEFDSGEVSWNLRDEAYKFINYNE